MLTILTLNLLNDLTNWEQRAPLILETVRHWAPDIIAFQEVTLPENNAAWLVSNLADYSLHLTPLTRRRGKREGLAILSRLPVESHEVLPLSEQNRVAQRVILRQGRQRLMFVNTHLFWSPIDDLIRKRQVERIMKWLPKDLPAIICGDFNALPEYKAIKLIKRHYHSAHEAIHGEEPCYTFPTPLQRGPGLRNSARSTALTVIGQWIKNDCSNDETVTWRGTLDYIFTHPEIRVVDCQLTFDQALPGNPAIYPSDHYGLAARLTLPD